MTLGKSFKVFPSKVHSSQTRAHLKVLMNQNLIHRAVLFCFSYRARWINAPIPNTWAYCLATIGIFWFPYFSLNLYIHWCSYTFFLGNAPWVLMLIYLVSKSLSPPKSYAKIKNIYFFPKIWATESFQDEYVHAKSLQSWLTLCDSMDSSPQGSSVYGILQARMLEWVAMLSSRGIFLTQGSNSRLLHCRQMLCCWANGEALIILLEKTIPINLISSHKFLNNKEIYFFTIERSGWHHFKQVIKLASL